MSDIFWKQLAMAVVLVAIIAVSCVFHEQLGTTLLTATVTMLGVVLHLMLPFISGNPKSTIKTIAPPPMPPEEKKP
jgi:anti-sigma-K factor RskA